LFFERVSFLFIRRVQILDPYVTKFNLGTMPQKADMPLGWLFVARDISPVHDSNAIEDNCD
jgi:hypothetical protein